MLGEVLRETADKFPTPADVFTIRDIGDWSGTQTSVFDSGSAYDRALGLASGGS